MNSPLPTLSLEELSPCINDAHNQSVIALALIGEQIRRKHKRMGRLLDCLIEEVSLVDGKGLPAVRPSEYHHIIGSLSRMQIDAAKEQNPNEAIEDGMATLHANTDGMRRERWKRIRSILHHRLSREADGERGGVATYERKKRTRKLTLLKRLNLLSDLLSHAHPTGFDAFDPESDDLLVRTIDAREPALISMGKGGIRNRIELCERADKEGTSITYTKDDKGYLDVERHYLGLHDASLFGRSRDVGECFGAKVKDEVALPLDASFGTNTAASTMLLLRWRDQLAVLIKRPRGTVSIEQAEQIWQYDAPPREHDHGDDDTMLEEGK